FLGTTNPLTQCTSQPTELNIITQPDYGPAGNRLVLHDPNQLAKSNFCELVNFKPAIRASSAISNFSLRTRNQRPYKSQPLLHPRNTMIALNANLLATVKTITKPLAWRHHI